MRPGIPGADRSNPVLLSLAGLALGALLLGDFATLQANRILPGQGLGLFQALGNVWAVAMLVTLAAIAALAWRPCTYSYGMLLVLLGLLLAQWPASLAWVIHQQLHTTQPQARIGLNTGLWALLLLCPLMLVELRRHLNTRLWVLAPVGMLLTGALLWHYGALEPLALVREYNGRSAAFWQALHGHLMLVGATLGLSVLLGTVMTAAILRRPGLERATIGILSFFQTLPSLALFGLLLAPLSYLSAQWPWLRESGVRGIGWAPALVALVAYSLLPIVRNCSLALRSVEVEVLEAARGMGMNALQLFAQIRLPLALPVMLEGLRITAIQAIGLTAVAALIGAEGFGTFIFQGLGQGAMDLVLLGALPTIALALLADLLFSGLAYQLRPGGQP
ncbi:MAG: ABC transporter permease [Pseudomonas sp.]|uniref:ABC transporter permease n=1 Tax=Pseudomonas sp. TaxID=306 RepID=UPI003395D92A